MAWAKKTRFNEAPKGAFVLDGVALADADLGDPSALLPLLVWHAESLYKYGINANGLGIVLRPDDQALLGRSIDADRMYRSVSELLCFVVEALEDARQHLPKCQSVKGAAELRSLVDRFSLELGVSPNTEATPSHALSVVRPQSK